MTLKRIFLAAAGFGAGFAIVAAAIGAGIYWYANRPRPWNKNALKATFVTTEFAPQPESASYKVEFLYDVQNTTQRNYDFQSYNFTIMAILAEGNVLSKELGHYQAEEPRLDGPSIIPAQGKARIKVLVSYEYIGNWTAQQKGDPEAVNKAFVHRLHELSGFAAFDQANHYEIDMPEGWRNWDDVKNNKD